MIDKLLKDLSLTKDVSPRTQIERLVSNWINEGGSEEEKESIIKYADTLGLTFMLPQDWFDDFVSASSEEQNKVEKADVTTTTDLVDTTIVSSKETADTIRRIVDSIKNVQTDEGNIKVSITTGEDKVDSFEIDPKNFNIVSFDDMYHQEEIQKAVIVVPKTSDETQLFLEHLIDNINSSSQLIVSPSVEDLHFDVSDSNDLKALFAGDSTTIYGSGLETVLEVIKTLSELSESNSSLEVVCDECDPIALGGDTTIELPTITKAEDLVQKYFSNMFIFDDSFSNQRNKILSLQEVLMPYGALINYVDKSVFTIQFQQSSEDVILDKLAELDVNPLERFTSKGIVSLLVDFRAPIPPLTPEPIRKAKKGTPQYEEWLRKYKEKKTPKNDSQDLADAMNLLRKKIGNETLIEKLNHAIKAAENEDALERMLTAQHRDSKGKFIKE